MRKLIMTRAVSTVLAASMVFLTGCQQTIGSNAQNSATESQIVLTTAADESTLQPIQSLGVNANVLPSIAGVTVDSNNTEQLAPINLTVGVINSVVSELQQRLMDLGYMDPDEPTTYYGDATSRSVQYFQRQMGMKQDGITGVETWDALMSPSAPRYAVKVGFEGKDVMGIQYRLYNLGYLSKPSEVSGIYTEVTQEAVKKLQASNGLKVDGTVGTNTYNLLYSDEVKANVIALGEQSDIVKKYQQRLIDLGYMGGTADGQFGETTQVALRAFQSRNNLVVDGYLGPDTRTALDSSSAVPYSMRLGEQSSSVKELQNLLVKYGYLKSSNATGYFGELTKAAVVSFQKNNKLTQDGAAGAQTMNLLRSGKAKKATRPVTTGGTTSQSSKNSSTGKNSSGNISSNAGGGATVSGSAANLIAIASSKIGCPYVWGSKGPNSFDCSGFVYWALNQAGVGVSYMTSAGWRNPGRFRRVSYNELQAGDIIVVSGHVGIVAGGGTVIDASSSNGRVVHRGLGSWWANHFIAGWRIFS